MARYIINLITYKTIPFTYEVEVDTDSRWQAMSKAIQEAESNESEWEEGEEMWDGSWEDSEIEEII